MKKLLILLTLSFPILAAAGMVGFTAFGQQHGDAVESSSVTVVLKMKNGKPLKKPSRVMAYISGDSIMRSFGNDAQIRFENVGPADTVNVVANQLVYQIAVNDHDSLILYFAKPSVLNGMSAGNEQPIVEDTYGVVSRSGLGTLPISALDTKGIGNFNSLADYLKGRVAGVQVNNNEVIIRGPNSLYSSSAALIIVDGIEMPFSTANLSISPGQIKSVTVDKMGSMYGSRGANGVVIIVTK